jgi:hypothetical protein
MECTPPVPKRKRTNKPKPTDCEEATLPTESTTATPVVKAKIPRKRKEANLSAEVSDLAVNDGVLEIDHLQESIVPDNDGTTPPAAGKPKTPRKRKSSTPATGKVSLTADDSVILEISESFKEEAASATSEVLVAPINPEQNNEETAPAAKVGQRARKPSSKSTAVSDDPAVEVPSHCTPLSEAELIKISFCGDRIESLVNDLTALEMTPDINDTAFAPHGVYDELFTFLEEKGEIPINACEEHHSVQLLTFIRAIMAHVIQGSVQPLSALHVRVCSALQELQVMLSSILGPTSISSAAEVPVDDAPSHPAEIMYNNKILNFERVADCGKILGMLCDVDSAVRLTEEIKGLAVREDHGFRSAKVANAFEDQDRICVWRWEVTSLSFFSHSAVGIIKEARRIRGHYGRAVKAAARLMEQIQKTPSDDTKIAPAEERATKSYAEVEKLREKRRELEKKRATDNELKRQKELAKEAKRKEKEEADEMKANSASVVPEKKSEKIKVVSEKEQKKAESLEKSKNLFMSFLKPKAESSALGQSRMNALCAASPLKKLGPLLKLHDNNVEIEVVNQEISNSLPLTQCKSSSASTQKRKFLKDGFDEETFDKLFNCGMSMADIMKSFQSRYSNRSSTGSSSSLRRCCRKPQRITVTISSSTNEFATSDAYSEIREIAVDSKLRTFSFVEDLRPAYV